LLAINDDVRSVAAELFVVSSSGVFLNRSIKIIENIWMGF
jgi:hypothetical protein